MRARCEKARWAAATFSCFPDHAFCGAAWSARPFRAEELALLKSSLIDQLSYFATHADDAQKLTSIGESKPDPRVAPPVLAAWTPEQRVNTISTAAAA